MVQFNLDEVNYPILTDASTDGLNKALEYNLGSYLNLSHDARI